MSYLLTITKKIENPEYDKDRCRESEARSFRNGEAYLPLVCQRLIETDALKVELTEEQFAALRKAAIETF